MNSYLYLCTWPKLPISMYMNKVTNNSKHEQSYKYLVAWTKLSIFICTNKVTNIYAQNIHLQYLVLESGPLDF